MKKNYTIKDLLVLLLGKVWYIVAASIVCAILALFVSKFVMSKQYQSHVSMYVKSADNQSTGQDKTNVDLQDINASKSLVQTYIVILTDDPVMNEVSDKLLEMYTPEQLAPYFTVIPTAWNMVVTIEAKKILDSSPMLANLHKLL